jgi:hypothetical protein
VEKLDFMKNIAYTKIFKIKPNMFGRQNAYLLTQMDP